MSSNGHGEFQWGAVVPMEIPAVDPAVYAARLRQDELDANKAARDEAIRAAQEEERNRDFNEGFAKWDQANLSPEELDNLPPQKPLIHGNILFQGTTAWLAAEWGSYKSFVGLDMALSIASGRRWLGRETERGGALYVAGEGIAGLQKRKKAWLQFHNLTNADLIASFRGGVDLTSLEDRAYLTHAASLGRYSLIVLDTQARVLPGVDENSVEKLGEFIVTITRIAKEHNTTVLVVHHFGTNGRMRGSTSVPGAADTILLLEKDRNTRGIAVLEVHKQKDTEVGEEIQITMQREVLGLDDRGEEITSLVPTIGEGRDYVERRHDDREAFMKALAIMLDILDGAHQGISRSSLFKGLRERAEAQKLEMEHVMPERVLADIIDQRFAHEVDAKVWVLPAGRRRAEWTRGGPDTEPPERD